MGDYDWRAAKGLAPPGYKWARIPALNGEFIDGLVADEPQQSSWQPIDTAPRDKWVLVFSQYDGCHVACWDYVGDFWRDNERDQFEEYVPIEEPTHWMLLPEPPK